MRNVRLILLCLVLSVVVLFVAPVSAAGGADAPQVAAESAHGDAHEPHAGMFDFDKFIILSQLINFFVLLFLLQKFLYVPVRTILEDRRRKIADTLAAAEAENAKGSEFKAEYQNKIAAVEQESYQLKQKAISEAQNAREEILTVAKSRSAELLEKAHKDIIIERKKAWAEMREEVVRLSLAVAERVIEKSLDDEAHHEMIHKAIEGLEKSQ
ncbi:MAG: F0F1 ATP synthase subunit B [Candidatus Riflebacteria bacterium]|nr:F0F1 ATP synthase subunit B [Candidatus Riflebacteria bacterium]